MTIALHFLIALFINFSFKGDILVHVKTPKVDTCFEAARAVVQHFAEFTREFEDVLGWAHSKSVHNGFARDISDFEDGTNNPGELQHRIKTAVVPANLAVGEPGGGSFCVCQKWIHNKLNSFDKLAVKQQEEIIGRTKGESDLIIPKHIQSHVSRTNFKDDKTGEKVEIVRQSMSFGNAKENGLLFIAYAKDLMNHEKQLQSMLGGPDGKHMDMIMLHLSKAVGGQYYYMPSKPELHAFVQQVSQSSKL